MDEHTTQQHNHVRTQRRTHPQQGGATHAARADFVSQPPAHTTQNCQSHARAMQDEG
jgi:hypothetical protein